MFDGVFKYSSTEEINFVSNDIFPDDGDNIQLGFNLNLMQSFGPGGQFIMPGLGITRTEYLKNNQDGRIDLIYFAGLSAIWQPLQWLSFQTFGNFSAMNTKVLERAYKEIVQVSGMGSGSGNYRKSYILSFLLVVKNRIAGLAGTL